MREVQPTHGTLQLLANNGFHYIPNTGYSGPDQFTYFAFDGKVKSNEATVVLTVKPPCALDVTASVSINQGSIRLNRKTGFFEQAIVVTNGGTSNIQGPVS